MNKFSIVFFSFVVICFTACKKHEHPAKEVIQSHYLDQYNKIAYFYENLKENEFDSLIKKLTTDYYNDFYTVSATSLFLKHKKIHTYDSELLNSCAFIKNLPKNYKWDIIIDNKVVRSYSTDNSSTPGFISIPNTICQNIE